ncbi:DNA excision repair protein ERCC-5 isoform X1 [Zeugodacus cucurbitae]|uniref:DNA excision repair protein ERCC-5 isoform X1 n=1 Tax=Zeugodacus cucurbitae TaxID=28588 RepID=UPI0023D905D6|nr:DNA excision repair protein ERCC-5 isoform X1 [Zeugodacus cucurbitae]
MGVTGLWKLVEPCGSPVPVETLEGKILAVGTYNNLSTVCYINCLFGILISDISIWLHQVVKGFQDSKGSLLPHAHLLGLFHRLCKLLYYRIRPVFVFDGCVPHLKRDTISRRQQQRSKLNNEADRIQALLLQSLAKERVVQQALGVNAELLMKSPSKRKNKSNKNENEKDDIFKLPDLPAGSDTKKDHYYKDSSTSSFSELSEEDCSFNDSNPWREYNANIQAIDVRSEHFKSLPPEVRHEILVDIKDTRKQSSWGRLHELPSSSNEFSTFQMKRLLKRRAVQESIEETEKEMGEQALTFTDLQNFFTEEGILDPENIPQNAKPVCSDEAVRFMLVRDLRKNLLREDKDKNKTTSISEKNDVNAEPSVSEKKDAPKSEEPAGSNKSLGKEYNTDLELAIALSMEDEAEPVYSKEDYEYNSNENLKLNRQQRNQLRNAAIGPARTYMIEYGGFNDEEVGGIMEKTQVEYDVENEECDIAKAIVASLNDISTECKEENTKDEKPCKRDESKKPLEECSQEICLRVSDDSETDSDLEEVVDNFPATCKNVPKLEVIIKTQDTILPEDDLFSDIFVPKTENSTEIDAENVVTERTNSDEHYETIVLDNSQTESIGGYNTENRDKNSEKCLQKTDPKTTITFENIPTTTQMSSILDDLKKQANDIKNIHLADVNTTEPKGELISKNEIIEIYDSDDQKSKHNSENREMESSGGYSTEIQDENFGKILQKTTITLENIATTAQMASILDDLKQQADDVKNINLDDVNITEPKEKLNEIIEIYDSDDQKLKHEITPSKSPKFKTPTKNKSISEYFETKYVVKRTPESNHKRKEEEQTSEVKSPFFVKKSPSSHRKGSATKINENSLHGQKLSKASKTLFRNSSKSPKNEGELEKNDVVLSEEDLLKNAANALKEQKSTEQLEVMASELAKERRDLENERNRQDRMGTAINQNMQTECQQLLRLFGIPYIIAPMEAEAQCAFLESVRLTHGTITDDSDIWLFGGRTVYKNFFEQNKHVLKFEADTISHAFNCDREKLIQLACLVGSDYTTGIHGIGTVTALEILAAFSMATKQTKEACDEQSITTATVLSALYRFRDWFKTHKDSAQGSSIRLNLRKKLKNIELNDGFPNPAVIEAYLSPTIDDSKASFNWGYPDIESIHAFTKKVFGWTTIKTDEMLKPVLKRINDKQTQSSIRNYFTIKSALNTRGLKVSKRVQKAIETMAGKLNESETEELVTKKTKPKCRKKQTETAKTDENLANSVADVPSTSSVLTRATCERSPRIPESNPVIPQREKQKDIMRKNKEKAAAVLKKSKSSIPTRKDNKKRRTD